MREMPAGADAGERLQRAKESVMTGKERPSSGIGTQKEKTVHAVLKAYMDPDTSHQEVPVGGYIADIFDGERITEVQTGSFAPLREKLAYFLPQYPVTLVHPIPWHKWVSWIDPKTGEVLARNRSTQTGTFLQAFRELYRIRPLLTDKNLTIDLLLVDMEEYRIQDGWSRDGKRGSHRFDRIPVSIGQELVLKGPEDYRVFIPEGLPEEYTSTEFGALSKRKLRTVSYSTVLSVLADQGIVERTGEKRGRSFLYRTVHTERKDQK